MCDLQSRLLEEGGGHDESYLNSWGVKVGDIGQASVADTENRLTLCVYKQRLGGESLTDRRDDHCVTLSDTGSSPPSAAVGCFWALT